MPSSSDGKRRAPADLCRRDLVDGDSDPNVGSGRLIRMRAGEESRGRAGVVPGPVAQGFGPVLRQAAQHQNLVLDRGERLQRGRERVVRADSFWLPGRRNHAVGREQKGHSHRGLVCEAAAAPAATDRGNMASSQGNASTAPAPRKNVRRGNGPFASDSKVPYPAACELLSVISVRRLRAAREKDRFAQSR